MRISHERMIGILDAGGRLYPDRTNGTWKIIVRHPEPSILIQIQQKFGGTIRRNALHIASVKKTDDLLAYWRKDTDRHDIAVGS